MLLEKCLRLKWQSELEGENGKEKRKKGKQGRKKGKGERGKKERREKMRQKKNCVPQWGSNLRHSIL